MEIKPLYKNRISDDRQLLRADGLDDAVIGYCTNPSNNEYIVVYSIEKILKVLMKRDGMTEDDALEYFDFNIQGAYVGDRTPIYVWEMDIKGITSLLGIDDVPIN